MKRTVGCSLVVLFVVLNGWAHVTFRSQARLYPRQRTSIVLNVPNERNADVNKIVVEIPDAFLLAGGRIEKIQSPPGWEFVAEKQVKPAHVLAEDRRRQEERQARLERSNPPKSPVEKAKQEAERQAREEQLKQWIKRITFQGGKIPVDGFVQFPLEITVPAQRGTFYFTVTQAHADGETLSWSEPREDAERPAATLVVQYRYGVTDVGIGVGVLVLLALLLRPGKRYRQWRKGSVTAAREPIRG